MSGREIQYGLVKSVDDPIPEGPYWHRSILELSLSRDLHGEMSHCQNIDLAPQ